MHLAEDAVVQGLKEPTVREKVAAGLRDALYNALPYVLVVFESWELRKALFKTVLRSSRNVHPIVGVMRPIPGNLFE